VKGYKNFMIIFAALFTLYIIAELNKPKQTDWTVTVSKNDKNPYGGYIVYSQLKQLFPAANLRPYYLSVYNQLNNITEKNTAYIILSPSFEPSKYDYTEMMNYVKQGNYVIVAATEFSKQLLDSLKLKLSRRFSFSNKDSGRVNFVNPSIKTNNFFSSPPFTASQYFSKVDTSKTMVLGVNNKDEANFIKVAYGKGALLLHVAPVCFTNYFMLYDNNASYTAKALSYVPANVSKIYWDEYYKLNDVQVTPLRFFLTNEYLRWALRLALAGFIIYILFQMKRTQRIIPIITPLKNSSLDFVKTVSNVYFNQKDNNSIAQKKLSYFLDFLRQRFYLSAAAMDQHFTEHLAKKSGVPLEEVTELVNLFNYISTTPYVTDHLLLTLDKHIDNFYKQL